MSETITFFASVDQAQAGDDEIRLVLFVKDSAADLAAAVSMFTLTNRRLQVGAYLGTGADPIAEFCAAIPQIKSGIQIRSKKPPVIRFDVPMSDGVSALRLVGYSERTIRFEVADEGEKVRRNGKAQQRQPKGPWGHFWKELHLSGFVNCPGVKEALEARRETSYEEPWKDLLHGLFGVRDASLAVISPEDVYAKFPKGEFPQVETIIEQAKRKAGLK